MINLPLFLNSSSSLFGTSSPSSYPFNNDTTDTQLSSSSIEDYIKQSLRLLHLYDNEQSQNSSIENFFLPNYQRQPDASSMTFSTGSSPICEDNGFFDWTTENTNASSPYRIQPLVESFSSTTSPLCLPFSLFSPQNLTPAIANTIPSNGTDSIANRSINYYPNFDPKEYFCDTVAVENASMVAQIVGKKGAKIKHLVAKYGIRIRTPNLDQEPVFIIKGKRADVYRVKQEIQSAADHFMGIERNKQEKLQNVIKVKNTISVKLYIPLRFIGLIIGRSGNIVRNLQNCHGVYIETPKFELRKFFHIFGSNKSITEAIDAIHFKIMDKSGLNFVKRQISHDEVHITE